MIENLFKAKRADTGEWVEGRIFNQLYDGGVSCCMETGMIHANDYGEIIGDWCFIDEETICKYSGITDKKGNKVFEGDRVKVNFRGEKTFLVCFRSGMFMAGNISLITWSHSEYQLEVVGNIHDRP